MPAPHHSVVYRPDALPAAQPTASKHWRHVDIDGVILCLAAGGLSYMMTSLARQLERLKVPGAHSRLGHDTRRTSLIFDAKEAANEDRLSVYHLGMTFYHWTLFAAFSVTCCDTCGELLYAAHFNAHCFISSLIIMQETKASCSLLFRDSWCLCLNIIFCCQTVDVYSSSTRDVASISRPSRGIPTLCLGLASAEICNVSFSLQS